MSRKNLGAHPFLFPQPVMVIGSYDEKGAANAMTAAWGGIVGMDEIIITLASHKTTENILAQKAFTINVSDVKHLVACDYVGIVSGKDVPNKLEKAGFTTRKSEFVNAPIINELPLALECELKEALDGGKLVGKIKNVSADEAILDAAGEIDLSRFTPISFDMPHKGYYKLGERVGTAFEDGKKLM